MFNSSIDRPNQDVIETDLDGQQNNLLSDNSFETSSLSLDCSPIGITEQMKFINSIPSSRENGNMQVPLFISQELGYLEILEKFKCIDCYSNLITEKNLSDKNKLLLIYKTYDNIFTDTIGLKMSSSIVYTFENIK